MGTAEVEPPAGGPAGPAVEVEPAPPPAAPPRPPDAAPGGEPPVVLSAPSARPASPRWMRWVVGVAVLSAVGAALAASMVDPQPDAVVVRLPSATAPAAPGQTAPASSAQVPASDPVSPLLNGPVLGAMRTVWIEARGQPSRGVFGDLFAATTGVRWHEDGAGHQRAVEVELLTGTNPLPVGQAREMAARLHPRDAQRVGVYVDSFGQTVEVFRSQVLADAFGGPDSPVARAVFGDDPPGTYIQIAERRSSRTTRVLLALGTGSGASP
jgi:hypothetical protein